MQHHAMRECGKNLGVQDYQRRQREKRAQENGTSTRWRGERAHENGIPRRDYNFRWRRPDQKTDESKQETEEKTGTHHVDERDSSPSITFTGTSNGVEHLEAEERQAQPCGSKGDTAYRRSNPSCPPPHYRRTKEMQALLDGVGSTLQAMAVTSSQA